MIQYYTYFFLGTIIHEFDPWFNFRALEYFEKNIRDAYRDHKKGIEIGGSKGSKVMEGGDWWVSGEEREETDSDKEVI